MGSGTRNFYNDAFARQGFGAEIRAVQQRWRDGRRDEAARLVPHAIGEKTNLLGTPAMIRETDPPVSPGRGQHAGGQARRPAE